MKRSLALILAASMALTATACNKKEETTPPPQPSAPQAEMETPKQEAPVLKDLVDTTMSVTLDENFDGTVIELSDDAITVNGEAISEDENDPVYAANDIVFYLEGQDFTYGEGTAADEHSQEEADKHTVVHITKAGNYAVSGKLSAGQIAIDLGKEAEEDPTAVVNLYLNGVDITCTVAPGVIFYNVYECGSDDEASATKDVDTSAAGANVFLVDGSVNNVTGSHVARIYKSVELSADGKSVVDSKKLHKYDAAFYSKKTMNVNGSSGVLNINADNEGLDSELHLTINGGIINIESGNDGINTNEDNISVTTINGGELSIHVNGSTGEGDGIDSNGWLVINGGKVTAAACGFSADSGIDSDMGIHIYGGTVVASGNMYDRLETDSQNYAVFSFAGSQNGGETYSFKNEAGEEVLSVTPENDFTYLIFSSRELTAGTYTLWQGETQLAYSGSDVMGFGGGPMMGQLPGNMQMPEGFTPPQDGSFPQNGGQMKPEDFNFTQNEDGSFTMPDGTTVKPEDFAQMGGGKGAFDKGGFPNGGNFTPPEGMGNGQRPDSGQHPDMNSANGGEASTEFIIVNGANSFSGISKAN